MKTKLKVLFAIPIFGLALGGCTDLAFQFTEGNPAEQSSCEYLLNDDDSILDGAPALCVECNSGGEDEASAEACGLEISVRCNSDLGDEVFGVAVGGADGGSLLTATAWIDDEDPAGPSELDSVVCHNQSAEGFGKQEWKCTNALKGNGKDATTFEAEIKYDESKDTCPGPI